MTSTDPVDTAWRIHAALVDWTGKVDTKASFALTLESAVIAGVIALSAPDRRLGSLAPGAALGWYRFGVVMLIIAAVLATLGVIPRTRWRHVAAEADADFVYFGHLKEWQPDLLAEALQTRDVLPVLTRQHVRMSKIAFQKHVLVQLSLTGALVAAAALLIAAQLH